MELLAPPSALPVPTPPAPPTGEVLDLLRQAVTAFRAGQPQVMAEACLAALKLSPAQPEALQLMGVAQHLLGRHEAALQWLDKAAEHKPDAADLHVNRGEVLRTLTRWPEAEAALRRALELLPENVEALNNLGLVLQARGRHAEADAAYQQALALRPGHVEALNNLGTLHQELRRPIEAEACYRGVLAEQPNHVNALNNLGTLLKEYGRCDDAVALYRRVLEIDPTFHRSWNSLGQLAKERGDYDEAMRCYQRSLELSPGNADTLYNIALADLLFGHLQRGFAGYEVRYHARSQNKSAPRPPALGCPMWLGEPLHGKHIALVREQGLGDQLQFCRYATMLRDAGAEVTLIVDGPLVELCKSLDGPTRVIAPGQMHNHRYDYWAFLLSLPHRLATTAGRIPAVVPYLRAPANKIAAWRARLAKPPGVRATVGLVWGGNKDHANNRNRSARLETLAPLLDLPGLRFVSLQKGEPVEELRGSRWQGQVLDLDAELNDYTDTAAAMAGIDLLISVDTSVVHLAGALNKPCWVLTAHGPDWRWLREGERTDWYPSLRLLRQSAPQDWDGVVQTIRGRLADWSPARSVQAASDLLGRAMAALNANHDARAEALCREALLADAQSIDGWHLLALALKRRHRFAEALTAFEHALTLVQEPAFRAVILSNFGNTQQAAGDLAAAVASYRESLALAPKQSGAWSALGQALLAQGKPAEAEAAWRDGLASGCEPAGLLNLLASAAQRRGAATEAEQLFQQSLSHDRSAPTEYNLANLYNDAGRPADAIAHYRAALAIDPHYSLAQTSLLRALQAACDFDGARDAAAQVLAAVDAGGEDPLAGPAQPVFPFAYLALPATRTQQRRCARQWVARQYAAQLARASQMRYAPLPARAPADRRLRIGYLSSDLHAHATAYLMAEVFERHDRSRVEVFAYSCGPNDGSAMRERLVRAVDHFIDCAMLGLEDLAHRIHADGIDVLIDLKGYTRDTRSGVLALRPAPVQVNFLGYPGTLGADFADYVIGDPIVTPLDHGADYDERIAQLPHCYQPNDRQRAVAVKPLRHEAGLPDDKIVLACFNYSYKITEPVFARWCDVLQRAPNTVLWLLRSNPLAETNLRSTMQARGLDPQRLVFAPEKPLAEHLARLQLTDLVLDTEPYNAHTTCSDALWVGVPVLTRTGDTFASRVATSLLHAAGVPELATTSAEAYVELAAALAHDPARLQALKQRLVGQRLTMPLFDSASWTRDLENLYDRMAWRQRQGLKPAALRAMTAWPTTSIERAFALYQAGAEAEALSYAEAALRDEPDRADGWTLLGILFKRQGQLDLAEGAYLRATQLQPGYADAWNNLGNLRRDREDKTGALAAYREAVRLNPDNAETLHNLGVALEHFGDWDDALAAFDATVQREPQHVDGHWNRALALLLHGQFQQGFTDYEWRFARRQPEPRDCPQPVWDGAPLKGRTVLIWAEQGFGDALQFLRFVPEVKRRGGRVVLEVLGEMMGLAARIPGVDAVTQRGLPPQAIPAFDCHVALMSLPHVLGTSDGAMPTLVPYVHTDASRCTHWRQRLVDHGWQRERELAVGWVWAGNPNVKNDAQRSPRFAPFAPWLRLPGLRWFVLQKGDGQRDLAGQDLPGHFVNLDAEIHSFDDTAAVVAELDLVITSDTSVAHLAGAMGKPVFVTLPYHRDWRWGLDAERSHWYPSARLFRQATRGDWTPVRNGVASALGQMVRQRLPRPQASPTDADGWLQRAFAAYQSPAFNAPRAEADVVAALQRAPRRADAWALLGAIQRRVGADGRAAEAYRRAIDVDPSYTDAWRNLANLHKARGEFALAEPLYAEALRRQPDDALALSQQSDLWRLQGRAVDAVQAAQAALTLRPDLAEAALHLGNASLDTDDTEAALAAYERSLLLQPTSLEARFNLGIALQRTERSAEAVQHFEAVLAGQPTHTRARYSLGLALQALQRYDAAQAHYETLLAAAPEHFAARFNLASIHLARGAHAKALDELEQCQHLQPSHLGVQLQIVHLRQQLCDWANLPDETALRALVRQLSDEPATETPVFDAPSPFAVLSLPLLLSDSDIAPIAARHAAHIAQRVGAPLPPRAAVERPRLRLAYASADFHNHATMHLMRGVFARHDRARYELSAWSFGPDDASDYRRGLKRDVDQFHDVAQLSDRALADALRAAEIDILIDLKGYTRDARPGVFALRPAPLQLTWLGYPGASAATWFDATIGDATVTPLSAQPAFVEPIVNLPHSYQCTDDAQRVASTGLTRADCGLPDHAVVLACFCTHYKLDADTFALWMRLLAREPRALLWLVDGPLETRQRLYAAAEAAGIARDRLVFAPIWSKPRHLERLALADLVLDTRFYNGHTTVSDALWAGVPVLSVLGTAFAGRVGASLLRAAGLPEGVTTTVAEHEALASRLIAHAHERHALRQRLREARGRSRLFDTQGFVSDFEAAIERLWQAKLARQSAG
ncbi:MAG TPA: tetratricopeptide repeat protein [Ideonella sp.]|uniref:O-linked N-acetylglucosamine transferase family protein n=1 Tax=Ideonella sp. TaxID=1929293 RepID=UPI002E36524B|nr:tetratricopeptide repeat protein [Ideonella sp.]HEX5683208.1 tetratricopeptide repeat protein [Ideonella sp.]